jgi:hypothetical protein
VVGRVWGTRGSLARDRFSERDFQRRILTMSCWFGRDSFAISDQRQDTGDGLLIVVSADTDQGVRKVQIHTISDSRKRWFVESLDLNELNPPPRVDCS